MDRMSNARVWLRRAKAVDLMLAWASMSIGSNMACGIPPLPKLGLYTVLDRHTGGTAGIQGAMLALTAVALAWGSIKDLQGVRQTSLILMFAFYVFVMCLMIQEGERFGSVAFGAVAYVHFWRVLAIAWGGVHGERGVGTGGHHGGLWDLSWLSRLYGEPE